MERNLDPDVAILNASQLEDLLYYARIGGMEAGRPEDVKLLEKHIRKWNPHIAQQYRQEAAAQRAALTARRRKVNELLSTHMGKPVYLATHTGVYAQVKLIARGSTKETVTLDDPYRLIRHNDISIESVRADLPAGYRLHQVGKWEQRYVSDRLLVDGTLKPEGVDE